MSEPERLVHLPEPMAHQIEVLAAPERWKVLLWGRRAGKTSVNLVAAVDGHGEGAHAWRGLLQGGQVWWVMPTYAQATTIWEHLCAATRDLWGRPGGRKIETPERRIWVPGGGAISIRSSDNPEALRGEGLDLVIVDEMKDHPRRIWTEALRPALADKHGSAIFTGTPSPYCDRDLLDGYLVAHEGRKGWLVSHQPTSANRLVTPDEIEDLRLELGEVAFARECLAQYGTPGAALFQRAWERLYDSLPEGVIARFATLDIAASDKSWSDWTVFAAWAVTSDGNLYLLELVRGRINGAQILDGLQALVTRHKLDHVYAEVSAYATLFLSIARAERLPIVELVRDRSKGLRAEPAAAAMERGLVWFPRAAPWLHELEAELFTFPEAKHDDQVDCLADAVAVHHRVMGWDRGRPASGDFSGFGAPEAPDGSAGSFAGFGSQL